jgi:hypothetical protein
MPGAGPTAPAAREQSQPVTGTLEVGTALTGGFARDALGRASSRERRSRRSSAEVP